MDRQQANEKELSTAFLENAILYYSVGYKPDLASFVLPKEISVLTDLLVKSWYGTVLVNEVSEYQQELLLKYSESL